MPRAVSFKSLIKGFLFPPRQASTYHTGGTVSAIIPSYKPEPVLVDLVRNLLEHPRVVEVILVDDANPPGDDRGVFEHLRALRKVHPGGAKLCIVRNERNLMCAGSVNEGLKRISFPIHSEHYILVLNDDSALASDAVDELLLKIQSNPHLGAVCANVRVANARKNLLTRLQRFEYLMFNVVRKADDGFLYGPLILPGMTMLCRAPVLLYEAQGYDPSCIIEDYELTVRLKKLGWHVALAERAISSTYVPEQWSALWRQRVRWYYGGLTVIRRHWRFLWAVVFDIFSHFLNLALFFLIFISFFWHAPPGIPDTYYTIRGGLLVMAAVGVAMQWIFFLWVDKGKDWIDVILRLITLPELYYYSILSWVVFGSYAFYLYRSVTSRLRGPAHAYPLLIRVGDSVFAGAGFTSGWGTK